MAKKIPIEVVACDYSKLDWRAIWNVLHRREVQLVTYSEALQALRAHLPELEAATLLYVVAKNGYQLKRYL